MDLKGSLGKLVEKGLEMEVEGVVERRGEERVSK